MRDHSSEVKNKMNSSMILIVDLFWGLFVVFSLTLLVLTFFISLPLTFISTWSVNWGGGCLHFK